MSPDVRPRASALALKQFLDEGHARAEGLGPEHLALWGALADATDGGKRIRPALVAASHAAFAGAGNSSDKCPDRGSDRGSDIFAGFAGKGADESAVAELGAAVELLHTALVIHDDVIDGDDVRRGRPNVVGAFHRRAEARGADPGRARHYGQTAGLLAGNLALAGAMRVVACCCDDPATTRRLLGLFDRALDVTAAGELSDVLFGLDLHPASLTDVLTMAERKTAAYSFALPLQAGAVLAGASDAMVTAVGEVGRLLGVTFQLLDDLQGIFGDEADTGKSPLGDLREGKQTALIVHARTTSAWAAIAPHHGSTEVTLSGLQEVRRLLSDCGSRRFVEELAADYASEALALVEKLGLPAKLLGLVDYYTDQVRRSAA